jgi:sugar-specific transcriptional regulator TrmB
MQKPQNNTGNQFQDIYTSLKELGLTDHEANLYLVSLKLGPSSIVTLAENLQISRPNVYKVIKNLENYGLAKFSDKEKFARNFIVEPPTVLLDKIRDKKRNLAEIDQNLTLNLPELLAIYQQGTSDSKIKIYKDKSTYINIFNQSLEEENKEILFFGSSKDFVQFVSWDVEKKWIEGRVKKGIYIKVLSVPSDFSDRLLENDEKELRKTKVLESKDFSSSFMLFGNKVVFWQPKAPLAIVIQDQFIYEMMKVIFEKAWEQAL